MSLSQITNIFLLVQMHLNYDRVHYLYVHVVLLRSTRPRPINYTNTVLKSRADYLYILAWCHSVGSEH